MRTQARELTQGTQELLQLFARSNPQVRSQGSRRETIAGRPGLTTTLANVSEVTGAAEMIALSTIQLQDGTLLYVLGVVPRPRRAPTTPCSAACAPRCRLPNSQAGWRSIAVDTASSRCSLGSRTPSPPRLLRLCGRCV